MIVFSVEVKKRLIGELRDVFRIAAGLDAIGRIGEQRVHDLPVQHFVRRRKGALHLVVDDAVQRQRAFRILKMIVPAFLTEYFFF